MLLYFFLFYYSAKEAVKLMQTEQKNKNILKKEKSA